jgi:transposase
MSNHVFLIAKQQELIKQLTAQNLTLEALVKNLEILNKLLNESHEFQQSQIEALQRMVFGSKSERFIDPENKQASLFDENNLHPTDTAGAQISDADIQIAAHSRKKKTKQTKELPRRIEVIPIPETEMICSCGSCKKIIKTEVKELTNYVPAVFEIVEQHRQVAACPVCQEGITTAPAPLQILPKIGVTEEFLSYIIVSKLVDRQPLYHLESKFANYGVDCSRQNMARWMINLVEPLRPVFNLLKDHIIDYDIASCDATSLLVLNEPGRAAETKSDMYCITGGQAGRSVTLYEYNATKHQEFLQTWFSGFKGNIHADADNCLNLVASTEVALSFCNAHARRKFEPIAKAAKGHGVARQALQYYSSLYKIEREAKDKGISPGERYLLRQEKSKPIIEKFNAWLDEIQPTVLPKSDLGKAVAYAIRHRTELMQFLKDGRLEIDNNHTERLIKPIVMSRKNFLFCNSVAGANALCLHFSLVQTAKLHKLDPYEYYVTLLKRIPYCQTIEDYEQLLPWNIHIGSAKK